jgi:hypothetical protein
MERTAINGVPTTFNLSLAAPFLHPEMERQAMEVGRSGLSRYRARDHWPMSGSGIAGRDSMVRKLLILRESSLSRESDNI